MLFQTLYPNYIPLFECYHGSKLHGTNGPNSDTDLKGFYALPTLDEYFLTRGNRKNTPTPDNGLEGPAKVEEEWFYIQDMALHLGKSQTNNMSMLFCPRDLYIHTSPAWEDLVRNRERVVSKSLGAYAGYAKGQSAKYTLKGERYRTCVDFILYLDQNRALYARNPHGKMTDYQWDAMVREFKDREGFEVWINKTGETLIRVVAKSFSKTTEVAPWITTMESLVGEYGGRARKADKDGQDIKAVYHAYRITKEAQELLSTGEIRYPSDKVPFYMRIRNGEFTFEQLQELIIEELARMNEMQEASTLPDEPDHKWLNDWALYWQKAYWGVE